jgi:hypothetical protein
MLGDFDFFDAIALGAQAPIASERTEALRCGSTMRAGTPAIRVKRDAAAESTA